MILAVNMIYNFIFLDTDFLRSTGKIYTVAIVALLIWVIVLVYLIRLEKRLNSIEDQMNKPK